MTNYETIETALLKAGYVLFHATEEYADYDRKDEHCTSHVRVNRKTGSCRIDDLIVPADRLMTHLFPTLTEEERKALEFFADGEYTSEPVLGRSAWWLLLYHHRDVLGNLLKRLGGGQA